MRYRRFGRLDWKPSALGFGCMRLPTTDGVPGSGCIDEAESARMIRHGIDNGINYVDTAYPYHAGNGEIAVGKALSGGYREKVKLATKSPVFLIGRAEDFDRYLDEQLKKLQTDHIDFYLLHALDKQRWENIILKHRVLDRAEAAKKDGRIGELGFSFHDSYPVFKQIIDGYDGWTFCQIQYNYMDAENQAGTKGLRYAASKGLAVVVMEPILGGRLANPPAEIRQLFDGSGHGRSPSEWALQWVWNQPEVSLVLSGMSSMAQVVENLESADRSAVGSLGADELKLVGNVRVRYAGLMPIKCTKCGYCMPCPNGVNIPRIFEIYNDGFIHADLRTARFLYGRFLGGNEWAGACQGCRQCEEKCPQKIPISEHMPNVHDVLGEGKSY
jgi:predicted aldo/keto reductase-like oxidoreductase